MNLDSSLLAQQLAEAGQAYPVFYTSLPSGSRVAGGSRLGGSSMKGGVEMGWGFGVGWLFRSSRRDTTRLAERSTGIRDEDYTP